MTRTIKRLLFMLITAISITSAAVPVHAATKSQKITVTTKNPIYKMTVVAGDKIKITTYNGKTKVANTAPTYKSNKTTVAPVSKKGVVVTKKAGKAVITIKYKKKYARLALTVKKKVNPKSVKLNKTSATLNKGAALQLTAAIAPKNATNKTLTWASSNTKVATVSKKGLVKGIKAGTATITVKTANNKKHTCKITVKTAPIAAASITLNKTSAAMTTNASMTLTATIAPANTTNKTVTWSSSNTSITTVTSAGKVTAKKAGNATITAKTTNGKTATCKITVSDPIVSVSNVALSKTTAQLEPGQTLALTATITPSNATDKTITWASSDTSVATVSKGTVTAKKDGTATITAKTTNGKSASCKVTVKDNTTSGATHIEDSGPIVTVNGVQFDISDAPTVMNIYGGATYLDALINSTKNDQFAITPLVNISPNDVTFKISTSAQVQCANQYSGPGATYDNLVSVPNAKNDIADIVYGKHPTKNIYGIYPHAGNKTGSFTMAMYYKGGLVAQTKIIVHSTHYHEIWLRNIVAAIENQCSPNDTLPDVTQTARHYIYTTFTYDEVDCAGGADILAMLFRCRGYRVAFRHTDAGVWSYDIHASMAYAGHVDCAAIDANGNQVAYAGAQGHD